MAVAYDQDDDNSFYDYIPKINKKPAISVAEKESEIIRVNVKRSPKKKKKTPRTRTIIKIIAVATTIVVGLTYYLFHNKNQNVDVLINEPAFSSEGNDLVSENLIVDDIEEESESIESTPEEFREIWDYRMTYFYPEDPMGTGYDTASGLRAPHKDDYGNYIPGDGDFEINENGWFTYQGKLVIATASERIANWEEFRDSNPVRVFNLYDELIIEINGVKYDGIVLDICGAAMNDDIIDLFVKDEASRIDTQVKVELKNEQVSETSKSNVL